MPAIIDELTFSRVAEIIKSRSHVAPARNAKEIYMLTGKIFCGLCGSAYVGCRQFTGRSKLKHVTYRCAKKNNYGDAHCVNKSVNLLYIENIVFKEVAKIVFNPARIPQLIQTYYDSCGELIGDSESKLKLLRANLKAAQQKLDNIVSVITQTGSPALLSTLEKLEGEKAALEIQISDEESRLISNTLNEKEIIAAFKHAKEMFLNGTLPQKKQLLNLYINRIDVYPEHIEIMLNNIPNNHLNPTRENALLPADNGGQDALHIFKLRKDPPAELSQRTGLNVVEARGVEPLSENISTVLSPGEDGYLRSLAQASAVRLKGLVAS